MESICLTLPTFNGSPFADEAEREELPDFGEPKVPVMIRFEGGLRVLLGTFDDSDLEKPDLLIERKSRGWMVAIHPQGVCDPSGIVYIHDDGRSFVVPDSIAGEGIELLAPGSVAPGFEMS